MIPPTKFRFSVEDFPDAPKWFSRLIVPLNRFSEQTVAVLDGGVSLSQNLSTRSFSTAVTTPAAYASGQFDPITFAWPFSELPHFMLVVQVFKEDGSLFLGTVGVPQWFYASGSINIQYVPGLTASTKYVIKFIAV